MSQPDALDKYYPNKPTEALNEILEAATSMNVSVSIKCLCASSKGGYHETMQNVDPTILARRKYVAKFYQRDLAIYFSDVVYDAIGRCYIFTEFPPRIGHKIIE